MSRVKESEREEISLSSKIRGVRQPSMRHCEEGTARRGNLPLGIIKNSFLCSTFCGKSGAKATATDAAEREQRLLADFAEPRGGKLC